MAESVRAITLSKVTTIEGRAVLQPDPGIVALHGAEGVDWMCPNCATVVVERVAHDKIWDLVVRCPTCATYSEFARLPAGGIVLGSYVFFPAGQYRLVNTLELKTPVLVGVGTVTEGGTEFQPEMN